MGCASVLSPCNRTRAAAYSARWSIPKVFLRRCLLKNKRLRFVLGAWASYGTFLDCKEQSRRYCVSIVRARLTQVWSFRTPNQTVRTREIGAAPAAELPRDV